jgi:glycosyltransferase involved in cell wall biosynthesis
MRVAMVVLNDMTADARVEREATTLGADDHEVVVVALTGPHLPIDEHADGYLVRRVADVSSASMVNPAAKIRQQNRRTRALAATAKAWRPDVVHAHDTPALPAAWAAARACGASLVYDAHELYPDSLEQQRAQGSLPIRAYWRHVERRLVPRADAVITVSDGLRDVLFERYGVAADVLPNVPRLVPIQDRGLLRRRLGIADSSLIVLYQGSLFEGRSLEPLVDAVASDSSLTLVVQGAGPGEAAMRERVRVRGIERRSVFMGRVAPEHLFAQTCGADIGTVFLDGVTLNHKLAWPNRLFMYFMAGIPAVVTDLPGMRSLVCGHGLGLATPPRDVPAMARAIQRLARDPSLRASFGLRARRLAETRFNWQAESKTLLSLYDRLAANRGA